MKFKCNMLKYNEGCWFLGVHVGGCLRKNDRHLRLQFDLFKYAVTLIVKL